MSSFRLLASLRNILPIGTRKDRIGCSLIRRFSSPVDMDSEAAKIARDLIDKTVKEHSVVLFMKGTRQAPMCGFSKTVVQILNQFPSLARYTTVNVLIDPAIRTEIKSYSNWPTLPQLYVNGEFVGGCDIVYEMYRTGALENLLKEKGCLEDVKE